MVKKAVLSVSDKTGIIEFAKGLVEEGFVLISTGGTFKTLQEAGIPVTYVSEITGFPEILDGRSKPCIRRSMGNTGDGYSGTQGPV
jgi:phosphoribosylaminoimidazolecarboxamide formyltransferase/IMP cyclohydrolase